MDERLPPVLAKRFRSGRPCLDFLHTGGDGLGEPELLTDGAALPRWLGQVLGGIDIRHRATDLERVLQLREALWRLVSARIRDDALPTADVEVLNRCAAVAPPVPELGGNGAVVPVSASVPAALSAVARDAIDLLSGPLGHRIRVCAGEGCELLFVDASRPGTRRWCSMERCGNRAKVRAHRARLAAAVSAG
jgi:predicted RNA-binding Zn ribbon-like protein